ncbi:Peroxidase 43 [Turnera subulata]|uniref:Peroxidase n=1 Tax=Turnera subulata TaxID=218843 RepID=A0A9Q0J2Z2_9ROSI|nr:Peroxidase 43 [Turnera subulata]
MQTCIHPFFGGSLPASPHTGLRPGYLASCSVFDLYRQAMASVVIALLVLTCSVGFSQGRLQFGFYDKTCPQAESIVGSVVREAALSNSNVPAVLLRLHFHDCFVEVNQIFSFSFFRSYNGPNSERHAFGHQGVGGFDVVEKAKAQLEAVCPGVVSCADIVALAARDAVALANGPEYQVPTGRRDGRISDVSLAKDMPDVGDSIQLLKNKFLQKGLSEKDLVVLSAAHTIGTTACFFMTKRLYNFFPSGGTDPGINPSLLPQLQATCPQNGDVNVRVPIDIGSEREFDSHILQNIRNGFAVLESDARLNDDEATRSVIDSYFGLLSPLFGPSFEADFVASMLKMGQIGVQGEIRRSCLAFN